MLLWIMETPVTLNAQDLKALIKENVREAVTEHLAAISATMTGATSEIEKSVRTKMAKFGCSMMGQK